MIRAVAWGMVDFDALSEEERVDVINKATKEALELNLYITPCHDSTYNRSVGNRPGAPGFMFDIGLNGPVTRVVGNNCYACDRFNLVCRKVLERLPHLFECK